MTNKTTFGLLLIAFLYTGCSESVIPTNRMQITEESFGRMDDGREAKLYTLSNSNNIEVQITNYGGIITSLKTPGKNGEQGNIVLGFDNLQDYLGGHPYFGALIGRYGNRIEKGRFQLDGAEYQLSINDGENHLHGGEKGFDKVLWDAEIVNDSLRLTYMSADGEEGYPGNLQTTVTYTLTDEDELKIEYEATTDKSTPVNLTAHSYFNLTGDPSQTVLDHQLKLHAGKYTPVNEQLIPTGEMAGTENTPFDFREFNTIGSRIAQVEGGYDHNFVVDEEPGELNLVAEVYDPENGRKLSVYTTEPGIQFYSGNFLDGSLANKNGVPFEKHSGLCLEPQHFPNSPNEPDFPSTILRPGETYRSVTVYAFSAE
ncbi:MAG: aldose epimerase family protein [Balneolaceae bacterium]